MQLCPRCREPWPEPPERFCIRCGAPLAAGELEPEPLAPMPLPPADGAAPPPAEPPGVPWDRRQDVGFFTALVDTTLQVLSKPRPFFRRMATNGGLGGPLAYGVLVGYLGLLATALYDATFESLVGRQSVDIGLGPEFDRALAMLQGGPGLLLQALVGPLALAAGLFVGAGLNHLGLMLLGGARRGFEATFRVCCYSKAANVIALIPLCGPFLSVLWVAVLTIVGLQAAHETTLARAVAAVLLPLFLACCCCLGSLGLLGAMMASSVQ